MELTKNQKLTVVVVCCGALMALLNQTLLSPTLPSIMDDMDIMPSTVEWLITSFMLISSVITPANALILEKITLKKVFTGAFLIFVLGSFLMGIAPTFAILLTGRILQAIGAGILIPTAISTMMVIYPKQQRGKAMGIYGSITGIGTAIGPSLSGLLITFWSWRMTFLCVTAVSLLFMISGLIFIKDVNFEKNSKNIDVLSLFLCLFGFSLLLYGLSSARPDKINIAVIVSLIIGLIVVVIYVLRQLKIDNPMLNLSVFKTRQFSVGTIIMVIISSSGMCNAILLPILIQNCYGQTAAISGLVVLPGAILAIFLNPPIGRLFDKYGVRQLAIVSGLITTVTGFMLCWPTPDLPLVYIIVVWSFRNIALITVLRVLPTWAINSLKNKDITHGNAIQVSARQIFGALFTAIFISGFEIVAENYQHLFTYTDNPLIYSSLLGINIAFAVQSIICMAATIYIIVKIKG